MNISEITQIYGSGPFGLAGARQVFVTETIQGWLDRARQPDRRYDPEGVIHDLFVMCPVVWSGHRRVGAFQYASPRIMDRLERLTARISDPEVRLFTGVFPRSKGQPCSQILCWRPLTPRAVLIGAEEDLEAIEGPLVRHESGEPPAHPHDAWCGFGRISIDWRVVKELASNA
jgi:hypothetical protein